MAFLSWPNTLPNPSSNNLTIAVKNLARVLTFSSGRKRVVRVRNNLASKIKINVNFSFVLTLQEFQTFSEFYDSYWKTLNYSVNSLQFDIGGRYWQGIPASEVLISRNEHSWNVSFDFECTLPEDSYSFSEEEMDSKSPLWPTSISPILEGASFSRISRDYLNVSDYYNISKTVVKDDKFVYGKVSTKEKELEYVFGMYVWWHRYCMDGSLPFRLPVEQIDLGPVNEKSASTSGFYIGKIISPPETVFNGYFGKISFEVILWPQPANYTSKFKLVGNGGFGFITNNGNFLIGVE